MQNKIRNWLRQCGFHPIAKPVSPDAPSQEKECPIPCLKNTVKSWTQR
jgi:hypothetical protein